MVLERFNPWKMGVISFTIALFVFSKQIAFFLVEENRYFFLWTSTDGLAIIFDVVLLGTVIWAISIFLAKKRWHQAARIYNHVLVLVVGSSILTLLPTKMLFPYDGAGRVSFCWIALVAIVAFSLGNRQSRLAEWVGSLCLIMSPLIVILFFQMATLSTWSSHAENGNSGVARTTPDVSAQTKLPIFLFVFDEWSYKRTTQDGEFRPEFPNLRKLSEESFVFQRAESYSTRSMHSLPAILFQLDKQIAVGDGQTFWEMDGQRVPSNVVPSIFKFATEHGYYSALQGFYLPYRRILGDQVSYCRSGCVFPKGDGLLDEMAFAVVRNLQWLTDPVTDLKRKTLEARFVSAKWYEMSNRMFAESFQLMEECPCNTLAFFHFPLPHGPFVFNPDASYHGPYAQGNLITGLRGSVEDYQRHLLFQDRIVGRIVEKLKSMGRYDDSLLIFTSDHEWRSDPDEKEASKSWKINPVFRKVPLVIKLPGQKNSHVINQPVKNNQVLKPVIESAMNGRLTEKLFAQEITNSTTQAVSSQDKHLRAERESE